MVEKVLAPPEAPGGRGSRNTSFQLGESAGGVSLLSLSHMGECGPVLIAVFGEGRAIVHKFSV